MEIEREEGEMSDNEMLVDDIAESTLENGNNYTVFFKANKNGLVVEQLENMDAFKLDERSKRFGVHFNVNSIVSQKQINELYDSFDIKGDNERHFCFDTLHLTGVSGLTTKDIFEYLQDYKPVSIEWFEDSSCNVVCQDHISVALALLLHSREIEDQDLKKMLTKQSPYHWREGMPHPKKDLILMRFATNSDKKITKNHNRLAKKYDLTDAKLNSKNPWGDLCQSWGIYDHQEIFNRKMPLDDAENNKSDVSKKLKIKNKNLAMRLGKRRLKDSNVDSEDSSSDSEWKKKTKTPRMRMHADDEQLNQRKQSSESTDEGNSKFAPLSIEVLNSQNTYTRRETLKLSDKFRRNAKNSIDSGKISIQSRLGAKIPPRNETDSSDESTTSDQLDYNIMSRVQKIKSSSAKSVWSRLERPTNHDIQAKKSDLRHILKTKKQRNPEDLREIISKTKHSNLRIEIDNK